MRDRAIQDDLRPNDPLLRAIAELRDQVDRLIDEQRAVLGGFATLNEGDDEEPERPQPGVLSVEPRLAALTAESPAKARRAAANLAFERVDVASSTPPRPVAAPATDPAPGGGRQEDPRERLNALAKHFDRKLRQAGGTPSEALSKLSG